MREKARSDRQGKGERRKEERERERERERDATCNTIVGYISIRELFLTTKYCQ